MKTFLLLASVLLQFTLVNAQDREENTHNIDIGVPEVAIVDIEGAKSNAVHLGPTAPREGGIALDYSGQSNSDLWINYSSVKSTQRNPTRSISVAIANGNLPGGVALYVTASSDAGKGDGQMGRAVGKVGLSSAPQDIITEIGSSYTGDGVDNGHNLTYELDLSSNSGSYAYLDAERSGTYLITYTISDN